MNRQGFPEAVPMVKRALEDKKMDRGSGFYVCDNDKVYVCWKDVKVVTVLSTAYLGHSTVIEVFVVLGK